MIYLSVQKYIYLQKKLHQLKNAHLYMTVELIKHMEDISDLTKEIGIHTEIAGY